MAMAMAMRLPAAHSSAAAAAAGIGCGDCSRSAAGSWQGPASTSFSGIQLATGNRREMRGEMRRVSHVRASAAGAAGGGSSSSSSSSIVPVKLESPVGQFLVSLLENHRHLFSTAAEQQIEHLAAEKEKEAAIEATKTSGTDLVLYKRIAEVKQQERQRAVVELIYALVVDKFLGAGAGLVPKIPDAASADQRVDYGWSLKEKELESVHTPEALEVMKEHLELTLGSPSTTSLEQHTMVRASKFRVGHMYAGTIVFGYFLKRLDQRYQLQAMLTSDSDTASVEANVAGVSKEMDFTADAEGLKLAAELSAVAAQRAAQAAGGAQQPSFGMFPSLRSNSKLKKYAMSLDQETLQMLATLRTKESLEVVERQTQALFGKPEAQIAPDGSVVLASKDDSFMLSLAGLRRLVLEAFAFGTFLWEAESYVDQNYNLIN